MNKYNGIIISLISGISTLFGYFLIYIKGDKNKIIARSLAFAGGVMIMLSIIDLIPSSINSLAKERNFFVAIIYSFIFFIIGYVASHVLQYLVHKKQGLYKTGIISMIGIIMHNIPEGIATYVLSCLDLKLGILLAIAIIMHNIPEGIGISIPIYYATNNKKKAFLYTLLSGISEPFGALLSMLFIYKYINETVIGILYAVISGLMIYIGYYELVKTSFAYEKNEINYVFFGALFILTVEIILKIV